jgi:Zn-dependent protease with chaperone function
VPTSTISATTEESPANPDQAVASDAGRTTSTSPGSGLAEALATGCALVACVVARLPGDIVDATGVRAWGLTLMVVVAVVGGARAVARAPFTLRRALQAGPDRTASLSRWAGSEIKMFAANVAIGTVMSVPLYTLLRATPEWWFPAWLVFASLTVLGQVMMPFALRARRGGPNPAPAALAERLRRLATTAGVDVGSGVVVAGRTGGRRCNAYVVGLGPTRRVVLEPALVDWPPELVDQAVAHELGHWRLGHTARRLPVVLLCQLVTLAAAGVVLSWRPLLTGAGLGSAGDPRSYPLLLVVGAVLVLPARCLLAWRDRAQERAADGFALTLLGRPDDFVAMLDRAAAQSGAPRHLPWWRRLTAGHPPIDERAAAAACRTGAPTGSSDTGA